jgi:hypothetical protein
LWWKRFTDSIPSVKWVGVTVITGTVVYVVGVLLGGPTLHLLAVGIAIAAWPFLKAAWGIVRIPLLTLVAKARGPDYERQLGFQTEFERDLLRLIQVATTPTKPLFIFVDDLDRAPPPIPVKLLEAINILIGHERCIFVVGLDLEMVAASIETKYLAVIERMGRAGGSRRPFSGRDFIEKLLQLEFALPTLSVAYLEGFLSSILESTDTSRPRTKVERDSSIDDQAADGPAKNSEGAASIQQKAEPFQETEQFVQSIYTLAGALPKNPRKIKRFINTFRLLAYIAGRRGLFLEGRIEVNALGAITLLALEYPEVYSILTRESCRPKLEKTTVWVQDSSGEHVDDNEIRGFGLLNDKERYRPLVPVLQIAVNVSDRINDYLSLSEVIKIDDGDGNLPNEGAHG